MTWALIALGVLLLIAVYLQGQRELRAAQAQTAKVEAERDDFMDRLLARNAAEYVGLRQAKDQPAYQSPRATTYLTDDTGLIVEAVYEDG